MTEIEALYRRRFPEFRRVAAAIIGDRDAAFDVVQDAFGAAIRSRKEFGGRGSLDAWVWRIVVNAAHDYRRLPLRPEAVAEAPSENGRAEGSTSLAAAIALLTERQRLVLFLRYYADLDYQSIAETLDVRPGTVAATLNAAHTALRRTLQEVPR